MNGILDVSEHCIDLGEFLDLNAGWTTTGCNAPTRAGFGDSTEAWQSVRDYFSLGGKMLLRPAINRVAPKAPERRHSHPHRVAIGTAGTGGYKRCLLRRAAPSLAAASIATPKCIINLNRPAQRLAVVTLPHRFRQLLSGQPGGFVLHAEVTAQRQRRDPVIALSQQKDLQKPGRQGQLGILEQSPGSHRRLVMAAIALNQRSRLQPAVAIMTAFRASTTLRPAQFEKRAPAAALGPIFFEKFGQAEPFLKLNRIPTHFVNSCFCSDYEISIRPSQ